MNEMDSYSKSYEFRIKSNNNSTMRKNIAHNMQEKRIKSSDSLQLSNVDKQDDQPGEANQAESQSKDPSTQLDKANQERSDSKVTND